MILEKEKRQLIQVSRFRNMFYDLVENGLIRILFELYDLPRFETKEIIPVTTFLFSLLYFDFLSQGLLVFQQQKQKNSGG